MKKWICLTLSLILALAFGAALAADDGADPLTWEELCAWRDAMLDKTGSAEMAEEAADETQLQTDDGYAYAFDFATFYLDRPEMTADSRVKSLVITSETETGPRGVSTWMTPDQVMALFYTENPELAGSRTAAVLYLNDNLPESARWAMVTRDSQDLQTIQYTVHERQADGTYTDAGLIVTLTEGRVSAIRAYGLENRISQADVRATLALVETASAASDYVRVPTSENGADLEIFMQEDLLFSGINFLNVTPEQAVNELGQPEADSELADGKNWLRVLTFDGCEMTWKCGADKKNPVLQMLACTGTELEGPRAVRVGDSFLSVQRRFRFGEGKFDETTMVDTLYGSEASGAWGTASYEADGSVMVRYLLTEEDGSRVTLSIRFEQMTVKEWMLYRS